MKVRQIKFTHVSGALFDAVVSFDPAATIEGGKSLFLRVTNGAFAGRYVPWPTPGLTADISESRLRRRPRRGHGNRRSRRRS